MKPIELIKGSLGISKKQCGIYAIYCIKDDKVYIGHTKQTFERRFRQHKQRLNVKGHSNPILQAAWNKYGELYFMFLPIIRISNKEERDVFLIKEGEVIRFMDKENRFNLDENPKFREFSEATKRKMSESRKGRFVGTNSPLYGKKKTIEHCKNLSEAHKGSVMSEEQKAYYRERFSGSGNPNYGKTHSDETKKKIGEKSKGRIHTEETKQRIRESVKKAKNKQI